MKVLFLGHARSNGCRTRYYFPLLAEQGIEAAFVGVEGDWKSGVGKDWDVIVIQRYVFGRKDLKFLRGISRSLIYDVDDPIMYRSSRHGGSRSLGRRLRFRRMVRAADLVIAATPFIAEEAARHADAARVRFIPSTVDGRRYTPKACPPSESVTLGWLGGAGTRSNLEQLRGVLAQVGRARPETRLKIVCSEFPKFERIRVEEKTWKQEDEIADLQSFDIGLLPNSADRWSEGKGHGKLFQYMAVGIPVAATPVGIVREVLQDGETGFLCRSEPEWIDRILRLIDRSDERRAMGARAREVFERKYSLETVTPTFIECLHTAASIPRKTETVL